jgi:hypothetical protein
MEAEEPRLAVVRSGVLKKVAWAIAWLIAGGILMLIFLAYQQPGLLIDLVNLRYCG